ncbi:MAG: radical SAM protein [Chloroflexi bacterium]|nr:radical SAM protein [Chloroflexota bacterium]
MPDVLYIHPTKYGIATRGRRISTPYPIMPMGIIPLSNLLREEGLSVVGLNYPLELRIDRSFLLGRWVASQEGVRLILMDLHWYEHSYGVMEIAQICRQLHPEAWILVGGFTASLYAREILENFPQIDFVIRGDAEVPLRMIATRLGRRSSALPDLSDVPNLSYRESGRIVENALTYRADGEMLDRLNFVDLDFLEHADRYGELQFVATMLTASSPRPMRGHWLSIGRGCHFDCSYCGGGARVHKAIAGREQLVLRSVEGVVEDIQRLQRMGVDQVSFSLDPAILGEAYWTRLFSEIRNRGIRIGIYNEFFQLPSKEFIDELVQTVDITRSELAFSPLSGSEPVRRLNGKFYTNRKLLRTLSLLKRHEVPIYIYFSLNLPGEDERAFRRTLDLARRIGHLYPSHLLKMINMCHTVDPCSPMSHDSRQYGIEVSFQSFMDYYTYCRSASTEQSSLDQEQFRGFWLRDDQKRSLEDMANRWEAFRANAKFLCYPVPRAW